MNRIRSTGVATVAFAFLFPFCAGSAHAAEQGRVPGPVSGPVPMSEYSRVCEVGYQTGKAGLDPVMQMGPGWAAIVEKAMCGATRHS